MQEGQSKVAKLRQELQQQQVQHAIQASKLKAACWDTTAVPDTVITPVGPACLAMGFGEFEPSPEQTAKSALHDLFPVHNMQVKKALLADEQQLAKVGMLTRVES